MRISRHQAMMQTAEVWSRRSTCMRRAVGAVISINNRVVSHGYNGPASGEPHCTGNGCADPLFGCTRSIHAEKNALDYVPLELRDQRKIMYTTESPCPECASLIVRAKVAELYYLNEYRKVEGLQYLLTGGVRVFRMTPAGIIIDYASNELVDENSQGH